MNNKKLGTKFERKLCDILAKYGAWVHFLSPDARGAQPFDIIAVSQDDAAAIDCKTNKDHIFRSSRLEDNQIYAFQKWFDCGNTEAYIAVLYDNNIYMLPVKDVLKEKNIDLRKQKVFYKLEE